MPYKRHLPLALDSESGTRGWVLGRHVQIEQWLICLEQQWLSTLEVLAVVEWLMKVSLLVRESALCADICNDVLCVLWVCIVTSGQIQVLSDGSSY